MHHKAENSRGKQYIPSSTPLHITADGTVRSPLFDDIYFTPKHGVEESFYVFLQGNSLLQRLRENISILEMGFGAGLNLIVTLKYWFESVNRGKLHFISVEKYPLTKSQLRQIYKNLPEDLAVYANAVLDVYPSSFYRRHNCTIMGATINLWFGDAHGCTKAIKDPVNAVYLDGFSPSKNDAMWQVDLFQNIYDLCLPEATLASFTAATKVRHALESVGFFVTKRPGFGRKRECIKAKKTAFSYSIKRGSATEKTIAVVGAGIVGCTVAYYLHRCGFSVTLYDKEKKPMCGASGNPLVVLNPRFIHQKGIFRDFNRSAFLEAISHYRKFPHAMVVKGTVALPTKSVSVERLHTWLHNQSIGAAHMRSITQSEIYERLGIFVDSQGLYFPSLGAVCPQMLAGDLTRDIPFVGSMFFKNVSAIREDICVLCLGADMDKHNQNYKLPLRKTYGTILWAPNPIPEKNMACVQEGYVLASNNKTVIGSSMYPERHTGKNNRDRELVSILAKARPLLGMQSKKTLFPRSGARMHAKGSIPLIKQVDIKMFVVTAMGARGFLHAPYCAKILSLILQRRESDLSSDLLRWWTR